MTSYRWSSAKSLTSAVKKRPAEYFQRATSSKPHIEVQTVDLEGVVGGEQPNVFARATTNVQQRAGSRVRGANERRNLRGLRWVILEAVDRVVKFGGFSEQAYARLLSNRGARLQATLATSIFRMSSIPCRSVLSTV